MDKKIVAKSVFIKNLYPGQLQKAGKLFRGSCPFHKDINTPNFYIYPETNSWYCFAGCGGGDNISFYMRLHEVDFQTALEELTQ